MKLEKNISWLCCDPGISGTGIVSLLGNQLMGWKNFYGKGDNFQAKSDSILSQIATVGYDADHVVIEWPTGRFSGSKGLAATNSDALLKLCFLIGRLTEYFAHEGATVRLLKVQEWRGTLPDEVLKKRVQKYWGQEIKSHALDAGGMAKYVIEKGVIK